MRQITESIFLLSLLKIWCWRFLARLIEVRIERKLDASHHAILGIVGPDHVATFNDIWRPPSFSNSMNACVKFTNGRAGNQGARTSSSTAAKVAPYDKNLFERSRSRIEVVPAALKKAMCDAGLHAHYQFLVGVAQYQSARSSLVFVALTFVTRNNKWENLSTLFLNG